MSNDIDVKIVDMADYGVVLKCHDVEIADKFEDFLTEQCFVQFKVKMEADGVSFFFGQASVTEKVRDLFERFSREMLQM